MSEVIIKKCPKCGAIMKMETDVVYTSLPPQYRYVCPKCGVSELDTNPPRMGMIVRSAMPEMPEDKFPPSPRLQKMIDMEKFRMETAKDILCAMVDGGYGRGREEEQAHLAVRYADELIKQLKSNEQV